MDLNANPVTVAYLTRYGGVERDAAAETRRMTREARLAARASRPVTKSPRGRRWVLARGTSVATSA